MEDNKNCCCSSDCHCGENCQCTEENKCCPECTCYVRKNKELVRKFYELIAARRYDEAATLCSDDFVYYPEVHTKLEGVQAFIDLEQFIPNLRVFRHLLIWNAAIWIRSAILR